MIAFGVACAIVSSITQALAHALLRAGRDRLVIRALIGLTGAGLAAPVCALVAPPTHVLAPWLALSAAIHAVYQLTLIRAYEFAEFSVAYPVARGVAPVATALLGMLLLGEQVSSAAWLGIGLVTTGLLMIGGPRAVAGKGLLAAICAGLLTTGYTLVDANAVRLAPNPLTFVAWFFVLDGLTMSSIALMMRRERLPGLLRQEWRMGVLAGGFSFLTYGAALLALRWLATGVAAALRETSVVWGMVVARLWLRERLTTGRKFGAALVACGAALIGLGFNH